MVQQSLDMRWHGWSLGHMTSGCVESGLVRVVLNLHLFTFRSDEAVAAADSVRCSYFLSRRTVIIGKTKIENKRKWFYSCECDSRIANVCLSVCLYIMRKLSVMPITHLQ